MMITPDHVRGGRITSSSPMSSVMTMAAIITLLLPVLSLIQT